MKRLAEYMRPSAENPQRLVGTAKQVWNSELLQWRTQQKFHCVLWGPPGSGKTTLAHMLSQACGLSFAHLSAVRDGVKEIREQATKQRNNLIFIDEIHRLSRSQQDILLPILEHDECWVIGATTESPRAVFQPALLSRIRLLKLNPPSLHQVEAAIDSGLASLDSSASDAFVDCAKAVWNESQYRGDILKASAGDIRLAWNILESLAAAVQQGGTLEASAESCKAVFENLQRSFTSKVHYDYASAMIKSMRGSDPDAALYYAIAALDAGEDVLFLLRRCVIFASEDVGNADPQALGLAVSAFTAANSVGMPEARIPLAQAVTYLAATVKSNKCYTAISTVRDWRQRAEQASGSQSGSQSEPNGMGPMAILPPQHLVIAGSEEYIYPHDQPDAFVKQEYLPPAIAKFRRAEGPAYLPSDFGVERRLRERLAQLWSDKH